MKQVFSSGSIKQLHRYRVTAKKLKLKLFWHFFAFINFNPPINPLKKIRIDQ